MKYLYRNSAGHERTVEAPMETPPPEFIVFDRDDEWTAIALTPRSQQGDACLDYLDDPNVMSPLIFHRVFLPPMGHVRWEHQSWKKDGRPKGTR